MDAANEDPQDTVELGLAALSLGQLLMTLRPERGQQAERTSDPAELV